MWSALHDAVFFVDQEFGDLKVTEIMYHPLPTQAASGRAINRIIGNDTAGGNFDLARVEFAVSPPGAITENDKLIITGASNPANNGEFTIHHVEGANVILKAILADENSSPATGEFQYDGDRYEFIELKNTGVSTLNLSGVSFTGGIRFAFSDGTMLAPGEFAVIAGETTDFAGRYPGVTPIGEFFGHLDNGGERLELCHGTGELFAVTAIVGNDAGRGRITFSSVPGGLEPGDYVRIERAGKVANNAVHEVETVAGNDVYLTEPVADEGAGAKGTFLKFISDVAYDDEAPWQLAPDGFGYSLVPTAVDPTGNPDESGYWRNSAAINGSPGADDGTPAVVSAILINEILTHTDWPQVDTIELYNPTGETVDLGGWWLTDDRDEPNEYAIPSGTQIGAGGYLVIEADNDDNPLNTPPAQYFGGAFSLSSHGEEVYLLSPAFDYSHGFEFEAAENGVTFGRYLTSQGEEHFPAQSANSLGAINIGPKVGPVVISEIMYHPVDGGHEFLELANISGAPVALYHQANRWQVSGIGFTFPEDVVLQAGEVVLLVQDSITTNAFAVSAGVPAGVRIYNYDGKLDNGGESIKLRMPDAPDEDGVPSIIVDEVRYDDSAPWPTEPDGDGPSLERITLGVYGNDPINWKKSDANGGTPGQAAAADAPYIAVAPFGINVTVAQGENALDESLTLWNAGIETLNYTVGDDVDWMELPVASGSSAGSNDQQTHTITFATAGLPAGTYPATITVSSAEAGNSPVTIGVTLKVQTPEIAASAGTLEAFTPRGTDAPEQTFEVWNQAAGILNYSMIDNADWLSVSPAQGTSSGPGDRMLHSIQYDTAALPAGTHVASIEISDPNASNSPYTISVTLNVVTPEIALNTTSLAPIAGVGSDAPNHTFEVWNSGAETLNYIIQDNASWLSVSQSSGSSTGPDDQTVHTVSYDTDALSLGTYYATISVSDAAASNSPQHIIVTLTVAEQAPFVAYNDMLSLGSTSAPNATEYDYSAVNEPLKDFNTGDDLLVYMTGSAVGGSDPYGDNGGNFTHSASDAYLAFNGHVDLTGIFEIDAANWSYAVTFTNLEPNGVYEITLTANRDNASYQNERYTKVTIEGAQTYTNASSDGVIVNSEDSVTFCTGYNTVNGYVAKWTGVTTGPDGSFSFRSEWDSTLPGDKGYAMSAFRLEVVPKASANPRLLELYSNR